MKNNKLDFDDINLIPNLGIVNSRSECSTSFKFENKLNNNIFKSPIIPANMRAVINEDLAAKLAAEGYFYIMHRFNIDTIEFCKFMYELKLPISISVGVNEDSRELLNKIEHTCVFVPDYITIDIAHGHSLKMKSMINFIKTNPRFKNTIVIAGNVQTFEAVQDLQDWGADAIKVGLSGGSACTTWYVSGFGSRYGMITTIEECARAARVPLIADGGIKHPGDIAKALVAGASMCMTGGLVSACQDSPGNTVLGTDGKIYKEYFGSASEHNIGKENRIEGIKKLNEMKPFTMVEQMNYLRECLQSSISYAGGTDLNAFNHVKYY